jgi:hypothetical protein
VRAAHERTNTRLPAHHAAPARASARGQALLILIVMLSIGAMLLVYGSTTEIGRAVKSDSASRTALEHARQALIGRAIGDANRPGSLPCPDGDDDGSADLFTGSSCPAYIGRLPWRTLGLGDVRDENGERLWYALSPGFRDHPSAPPLNTDTRGTLTVYSGSDATAITKEAVAVVFAAGSARGAQARDETPAQCSTTGKHVPRNRCPANYLDTAGTVNNASAAGPFIVAPAGQTYNDKLAVLVTADFMPLVEQRVALETRNALLSYRSTAACACYPWADSASDGASDAGANRGRIPALNALPEAWKPGMLPAYFIRNDWTRVIHYSVARNALESAGRSCKTCADPTLSMDGMGGYDVILLTAGFAASPVKRASDADYIDDIANRDGDDRYVTPVSQAADRDRIYAVTASESGCAANARVLADNAPCGSPEKTGREICRSAAAALDRCRCAAAAAAIVQAPCATTLNSPQCELAITDLKACTP